MDAVPPRLVRALADRIEREDRLYRQKLTDIAATLDDVILMGLGDPDAPTPAHVKDAAIQAIRDNKTHYTHPAGMPELRQAIAAMLGRDFGLDYAADEVMVTAGTQEGVMLCALAFLNPGDEMLVPSPRFTSYDTAVALAGGKLVDVPTVEADDFAMNPDTIEALITDRTKVLVLITPGNPTGGVTPPDKIRRIAEICQEARHRGDLGRDLRRDPVRRGRASVHRHPAGDEGTHDHHERLFEKPFDDRLAHRLSGRARLGDRTG